MSRDVSAIIHDLLLVAGCGESTHIEPLKDELEQSLESLIHEVLRNFFLEMFETDEPTDER